MEARSMSFSQVIVADAGAHEHFHVPKYQREYTWGRKEWEQLLLDIDENALGYFMGSLICVNDNAEHIPGDELIYEVVDDQQRFTTLSLLLMALYANLEKKLKGDSFGSAYQILLFLFSLPDGQLQPKNFLAESVNLLCRYHIRRNVTDTPATCDLDPVAIELIETCAETIKLQGNLTLETFTRLLLEGRRRPASLERLRAALEGPIYDENAGMARYLLIQLDLLHHTREYQPDLWARDDKERFVWTIEHVLPQTEKLPQHWIQMLGAGNLAEASAVQEKYVNCLGNLTLSGYNSDLATSSFEKKQQLAKE